MADVTNVYHQRPYPALNPEQFDFSGKTILVSGISSIIGQAIARSFLAAHAAHIVCVNRNPEKLEKATQALKKSSPATTSKLSTQLCDIADPASVEDLWNRLDSGSVLVDVLVLLAADFPRGPIFPDQGLEHAQRAFNVNIIGNLRMVEGFAARNTGGSRALINIASAGSHISGLPGLGLYHASKLGFASLLQQLAAERKPEEIQIISVHPGAIFTEAAAETGFTKDSFPWDDASPHARFLHGRFVWSNWDVEELTKMKPRFEEDPGFLALGLQGIPTVEMAKVFPRIIEKTS
ncbi:hypothetical protein FH972_025888 [Carpinus fangiana]|uniref:Uncharacterized protein n=1 Tax=Carpinus fangiana TaxID=176857 RepID=A0A5N6L2Q9_9ROSI|nr:hypothetical protein FH972_025888 [Carpinus fangiana]